MSRFWLGCFSLLGAFSLLSMPASAADQLIVSTQGSIDRQVREFIVPKMKSMYGIDVATTPSLSAPALAKAMGQRRSPQIDVFLLDAGPWLQGKNAGLWTDVPASQIKNLDNIDDKLKDPKGVPYSSLVIGLLYDSSKLKVAPVSLHELADVRYRGKLSVPTFSSTFAFALLAKMDKLGTPVDASKPMDAGFSEMKRIAPNIVSYYGGGAQLVDLFKQGEIELAWGAYHVAAGLGKDSPVKWTAPAEGASLSTVYAAIAEGSKNVDAAAKFLDLMLSPEFQAIITEQAGVAPVNPKATLSPEYAKSTPLTAEVLLKSEQPPWSIFNASRIEMNERWQRDLEGK